MDGWLTSAGQRVTIVDSSPIVVRELNDRGIRIDERDGSALHFPASATTHATELESPQIVFFFVKSAQTGDAADLVAPTITPDTAVVTLQNGFGNVEALAARFSARQIVRAPRSREVA